MLPAAPGNVTARARNAGASAGGFSPQPPSATAVSTAATRKVDEVRKLDLMGPTIRAASGAPRARRSADERILARPSAASSRRRRAARSSSAPRPARTADRRLSARQPPRDEYGSDRDGP